MIVRGLQVMRNGCRAQCLEYATDCDWIAATPGKLERLSGLRRFERPYCILDRDQLYATLRAVRVTGAECTLA